MIYIVHSRLRRIAPFIVIIFIFAITFLLWPRPAIAETPNGNWSWTTGDPTVALSNVISDIGHGNCSSALQKKDIHDEFKSQQMCVKQGSKIDFGTSYDPETGASANFVGFHYDDKMHRLLSSCSGYSSCTYSPINDTLVIKTYLTSSSSTFRAYRNFSSRLTLKMQNLRLYPSFDDSNPDYIIDNDNGNTYPINATGVSDNGQWLAVEFYDRGIGLFNMETFQMKRITSQAHHYNVGFNPSSEIAVSNDGRYIAVMGLNSGFDIYEVDDNCGGQVTYKILADIASLVNPCKTLQVNTRQFIDSFRNAVYPRFNDDGGELSFYATSYSTDIQPHEIILRANNYFATRMEYLALGDSFTSGEGETDDKYYQPGTNDRFERCHVSTRSYPYLVASLQNINLFYVRSVACSGATTQDIIGDNLSYWGQFNRLSTDSRNLAKDEKTIAQTEARYSFIPGRIRQESFVKEYQPKIITVGIGGNDAGLMEKLKACVWTGTCNWASEPKKKEQVSSEIKGVFDKLVSTYQQLNKDSPLSRIYAIGYPMIIDQDRGCGFALDRVIDDTEKEFMNESITYLNQVVAAAAKAAGIRYIDISDSFGNQILCGSGSPIAMNAVRFGDDTNLVNDSEWLRFIGNEGFHPNSIGHELDAISINQSVNNLTNFDYCMNNSYELCPDNTVKAPEPSSYWIPDGKHDYPALKVANFVSDCSNPTCSLLQRQLTLDPFSLKPNSSVNVEINSITQDLGQYTTNSDGSLNIKVNLPPDLDEGYHTIHLYGSTYAGESIELYQVIEYVKPVITKPSEQPTATVNKPATKTDSVISLGAVSPITKSKTNEISTYVNGDANSVVESTQQVASSYQPAIKGASSNVAHVSTRTNKEKVHDNTIFYLLSGIALGSVVLVTTIKIFKR